MKPDTMTAVAAAFKELARVLRIAQVGGRRVERFEEQQRIRWVEPHFGPNRRELRRK